MTDPAPDEVNLPDGDDCNDEPKLTAEEWAAVAELAAAEEQR